MRKELEEGGVNGPFQAAPSPDTVVAGEVKDFSALEIRNGSLRFYLSFGDKTRIAGDENDFNTYK